ncbi:MAG: antibiotic biosynthesis monooxygenase [Ignavibacteriales bacterium]|nr:antibiotic biosynthesis monooxygenase [Ignavibacteriales bacterium]
MSDSTFVTIWKFRPKKGREAEFERVYGPEGAWARLFQKGKGFLRTELYADEDGAYLVIDEWVSQEKFEKFKQDFARVYRELDKQCEELNEEEIHIGSTTRTLS